jgi:hypothetical protein
MGGDDGAPARDEPSSSETTEPALDGRSPPRLVSRVLVTWLELLLVSIGGGLLAASADGPVGFVVFLATTLASLGVVFYNVNELVKDWLLVTDA